MHLSQLSTPGNVYKIDDVCRRHPQTFIFEFEAEFFLVKKVLQYLTLKNMFLEHFKRIYWTLGLNRLRGTDIIRNKLGSGVAQL